MKLKGKLILSLFAVVLACCVGFAINPFTATTANAESTTNYSTVSVSNFDARTATYNNGARVSGIYYIYVNVGFNFSSSTYNIIDGKNKPVQDYILINGRSVRDINTNTDTSDFHFDMFPATNGGGYAVPIMCYAHAGTSYIQLQVQSGFFRSLEGEGPFSITVKDGMPFIDGDVTYVYNGGDVTYYYMGTEWKNSKTEVSEISITGTSPLIYQDITKNIRYAVPTNVTLLSGNSPIGDYHVTQVGKKWNAMQNFIRINGKSVAEINGSVDDSTWDYSSSNWFLSWAGSTPTSGYCQPIFIQVNGTTLYFNMHKNYAATLGDAVVLELLPGFGFTGSDGTVYMNTKLERAINFIDVNGSHAMAGDYDGAGLEITNPSFCKITDADNEFYFDLDLSGEMMPDNHYTGSVTFNYAKIWADYMTVNGTAISELTDSVRIAVASGTTFEQKNKIRIYVKDAFAEGGLEFKLKKGMPFSNAEVLAKSYTFTIDPANLAHVYTDNCDKTCNVCDAERVAPHYFVSECDTTCSQCGESREASAHSFDNGCDTTCNLCGFERETNHVYDNACDAYCNECSAERTPADHVYDDEYDADCNECGEERDAPSRPVEYGNVSVSNFDMYQNTFNNGARYSGVYHVRINLGFTFGTTSYSVTDGSNRAVQDYITFNGRTMRDINTNTDTSDWSFDMFPSSMGGIYAVPVVCLVSANTNYLDLRIHTNLLKEIEGDCFNIGIKNGLTFIEGEKTYIYTGNDVTYYYMGTDWTAEKKAVTELSTRGDKTPLVYENLATNVRYAIPTNTTLLGGNSPIGNYHITQPGKIWNAMQNFILVNGRTVAEINATVDDSTWDYSSASWFLHWAGSTPTSGYCQPIFIQISGTTLYFNMHRNYAATLGDAVVIEFLPGLGFTGNDGTVYMNTNRERFINMVDVNGSHASAGDVDGKGLEITNTAFCATDAGDEYYFDINLSGNMMLDNHYTGSVPFDYAKIWADYMTVNGTSISELTDSVRIVVATGATFEQKNKIRIYVKDSFAADTLEISLKKGMIFSNAEALEKDYEITVDPASAHEYSNACDADCNKCGEGRIPADHVYSNNCDADCNECGEERTPADHVYDNACDADCNECGEGRTPADHVYSNNCDADCNECGEGRTPADHVYSNACDADCNECGEERTPADHVYDNACDVDCNVCGEGRTPADHVYDNACDADCNVCGEERTPSDHVYDNNCDADCNECGEERTPSDHVYSNNCDADCNECGEGRTPADHVYSNACDADCNECGESRTPADHVYDNACDADCNVCGEERTPADHVYDYICDAECNVCGGIRDAAHVYDNNCDADCNECGEERTPFDHVYDADCDNKCNECQRKREAAAHTYDDESDTVCNKCGKKRAADGCMASVSMGIPAFIGVLALAGIMLKKKKD